MSCGHPSTVTSIEPRSLTATSWDGCFAWIGGCLDRGSQRRALSELDDHLLRDIGITRLQALREAGKPIWRA
jgi:hypothetical protein